MISVNLFHKLPEAYGFKPDDDLLEKLLTLNLELAEKEKRGEAIVYRLYGLSEEEIAIVEGREMDDF